MTVLILASDLDANADDMITALDVRGMAACRVNTAWFPAQLRLSVSLCRGRWSGQLRTPAHIVELEEIHDVWYRSTEAYRMPAVLSPVERHHRLREAKYGLGGVLAGLPVLWVNHPSRLADAAYKPVQLVRAHECGLSVPETVITNEPESVCSFAAAGRTVTKLMGANTISEEGRRKLSWTRVLGPDDLDDLRGPEVTSHLVQRWVPQSFEVRVVVIDDRRTAVKIKAGSPDSSVDWRSDYAAWTYELIEPPDHVAHVIHALMCSFDLMYGALDFIVSPDGEWVFLEVNTGGQYGWLEAATGVPLTGCLADVLVKGKR
ncbi:MAG: RimK domain-containing protein [Pseudonocardiales bacterium]|nr:RimK domain-containing protein [Pseudonocardiales bacterium]MBV9029461.1 RimK domain-containing protein [Pseudonocardiales bacterium]MBW0010087.1 RimK domain-containing protein [Pseudonocardiales bacterium]